MKSSLPFFLLSLLCAVATIARAESDRERELRQLIEQRDAAVAAATAPINARFKSDAEQLLRRATQTGDTVAAEKIKAAIGAAENHATESLKDLKKQLAGTTWKADPSTSLWGGLSETLTFTDSTVEPGGLHYTIDSHNTITITFTHGDKQVMTLTHGGKRLQFSQNKVDRAYDLVSQ